MGKSETFMSCKNIGEGFNYVIDQLNECIRGSTIMYDREEKIYSPMQEILNEFVKNYNDNNNRDSVSPSKKFENIDSLENIKKECSDSQDINDYVDIFKDIFRNSEKINEIKGRIIEYNKCLEDLEDFKDIKLDDKSKIKKIKDYFKRSIELEQKPNNYDELCKSMKIYNITLAKYNEIVNLELPKNHNEYEAKNIKTIKSFREYCNEITRDSDFNKSSIEKNYSKYKIRSKMINWAKNKIIL